MVGVSGSGKTNLAARLAERLAIPHLELDSIFHQPGWEPLDGAEFRRRVSGFVDGDAWVVDGNYSTVRDLVWSRADTVVFIDLPRSVAMRRVVLRTLGRTLLRKKLWNGNREEVSNLWKRDPESNIVLWTWTTHRPNRHRYLAASSDPAWSHLTFHRLETPRQVRAFASAVGDRHRHG